MFLQKEDGEIIVNNTSLVAIQAAQAAVAGSKYPEDEVLGAIMQSRYGEQQP